MNSFEKLLLENSQLRRLLNLIDSKVNFLMEDHATSMVHDYTCPYCKQSFAKMRTGNTKYESKAGILVKVRYGECPHCNEQLKVKWVLDEKYK